MNIVDNQLDVVAFDHPFKTRHKSLAVAEGATVGEIVRQVGVDPRFLPDVKVVISRGVNAYSVPLSDWDRVRPKVGSHVLVGPEVAGPLAGVLLSALLPKAAGFIAGSLFASGTLAYALTSAAVTIVGSLLIKALIPPPAAAQGPEEDDPNFSITGSGNVENRYGVFPTVLGRHLMYPPKTARGYTEGEADNIHFRGRFTFGYGPVALETLRIGTTPIWEYEGVSIEFLNVDQVRTLSNMPQLASLVTAWRSGSSSMSLYPDDVAEDAHSAALSSGQSVVRSTRDRAESVSVDVTYQGLVRFDDKNRKQEHSVSVRYRYRPIGGSWVDAGTETHKGKSTAQLRFTKTIKLPESGEYDIEVMRLTSDSSDSKIRDTSILTAIRSVQSGALPSHPDIAEIAVRIKASDQLNGQLDSLNGVVQQLAPIWTGSSWTTPQPVRHPAWIYARALMGPSVKSAVAASRLQLDDLMDWAAQEPHWTCDAVIDQPATTAEILDLICATGRARRTLRDLKYSIIRDGGAGPVIQQFSPRNSWGFSGTITFPKEIHGFRVRCLSERLEWEQDEITVYADGYHEGNATELETMELRGVVLSKNDDTGGNAWRLGRYHLAQLILRPEEYTWECDLDHLRVNMGDKVRLVHDVPLIGVGAGRVRRFESNPNGTLAAFVLDEFFSLEGNSFRVCLRKQNGDEVVFNAAPPTSYDGRWSVSEHVIASGIQIGDLVSIEEMTLESMEVLVRSIRHGRDMKATLTGVPAAPAVLSADTGTIPAYVPQITKVKPRENLKPGAPAVRAVDLAVRRSPPRVVAQVSIAPEDRFLVSSHLGVLRKQGGEEIQRAEFTGGEVEMELPDVGHYTLSLYAKDTVGRLSEAHVETIYRDAAFTVPDPVSAFAINVIEQQAFLSWATGIDELVDHFHVRFLADGFSGGWERAVDVETLVRGGSLVAPALKGRYLIKAVSIFGQESAEARVVESDIDPLAYYNAIVDVNEAPAFTGAKDAPLVADGISLTLPVSGQSEGASAEYAFANQVDLGEIYTSRLTFKLLAYGFLPDHLLENWTSLETVKTLSGLDPDSKAAQISIFVRSTEDDPASPSAQWTDWQSLRIGEYKARGYEFKLLLQSFEPDVAVRVDQVSVQIDMPDRSLSARDITCPTGGVTITFDPPFKETPAIFVNGQGLPTGAVSVRTAESRSGFHQKFTDSSGIDIAASFDWQAVGFGRST